MAPRNTHSQINALCEPPSHYCIMSTRMNVVIRWDEKAGLRRDAIRSQVIDALKAQEIKETGNEED